MQRNTQMTTPTILRTKPRMLVWFCTLAVAMLLLLAACGSSTGGGTTNNPTPTPTTAPAPTATAAPSPTATSGNAMEVDVTNNGGFAFTPATLTVPVGTTVTWRNTTSAPHTVTSDTGNTLNGMLSTGGTYSFTFTTAGTYAYHCSIHPFMKAMIIVH
jgi:plastocyanin